MSNLAGAVVNIKRLSRSIKDQNTLLAVQDLENKILEVDRRLTDLERRVAAGGL